MEENIDFMEPLLEKAEDYGRSSLELLKFKALDKTAEFVSTLVARSIAWLSLLMFILISNIGIALWLGDLLGSSWYGFFCVAGFYGVLGFVLYFLAFNWIKKCVSNSIICQFLN